MSHFVIKSTADSVVLLAGQAIAPSDHGFNGFCLHCLAAVTSSRASNLVNRPVLDTAGDSRLAQGRERVLCSGLQRKQSYNIQRIVSTLSFCFSISFFTAFRSPPQNNRRPCFRRCFAHSPEFVRRPRRRLCATVHLDRVAPSQQWYILANALHQLASEDFAALATASLLISHTASQHGIFWRREWGLNPHTLSGLRFSRPLPLGQHSANLSSILSTHPLCLLAFSTATPISIRPSCAMCRLNPSSRSNVACQMTERYIFERKEKTNRVFAIEPRNFMLNRKCFSSH